MRTELVPNIGAYILKCITLVLLCSIFVTVVSISL